ncbi:hypothetical protein LSAT2_024539 [Lamellibrachia satsuma]|nr:hypothetical protein LSAT2_024539 [Lamellibrachia satsuma]
MLPFRNLGHFLQFTLPLSFERYTKSHRALTIGLTFGDVDECESKPCQNGGTCTDGGVNTYTCSCAGGYNGVNCQIDVDECDSKPCLNGGTCTDGGVNTYTCSCAGGYSGVNCQNDVDECESKPCLNGGTCTDGGVNTYTCSCAGGYSGVNCQNGTSMYDVCCTRSS